MNLFQTGRHAAMSLVTAGAIATSTLAAYPAIAQSWEEPSPISAGELSCQSELERVIQPIISQPQFHTAQWGIVVESLSSSTILYSYNADQYFIPASNIKLLTTATALEMLDKSTLGSAVELANRIQNINQNSDNAIADALFFRLGGAQQIRDVLTPLGIDPSSYRQVDGSGLSRYNMVQPRTLVSVLRLMQSAIEQDLFYNSLPIAGVNGTLRRRFIDTPAQGRVRAKTGTLRGVRALSGYLDRPSGDTMIFSILVNQPGQSGEVMLDAIDQIVLELVQSGSCR